MIRSTIKLEDIISRIKISYDWGNPIYGQAYQVGTKLAKKEYKVAAALIAGYALYKIAERGKK